MWLFEMQEPNVANPIIELEFTTVTPLGEAIGRHEGKVVFVPFALSGERAMVELTHQRKKYAVGRIRQLLQASPDRVEPRCPHFMRCGGCELQHMRYEAQLKMKTAAVREQLTQIGKLSDPNVLPCVPAPREYNYRNRAQFVINENGKPSYRARRSKDAIEIDDCHIIEPLLNEMAHAPNPQVNQYNEIDVRVPSPINVGGFDYHFSRDSFFQVNRFMAEKMVALVCDIIHAREGMNILDLYCGAGLFTVPLAQTGAQVTGIELAGSSIADAQVNIKNAGLDNVQLIADDVRKGLKRLDIRGMHWDVALLDPPRAGVDLKPLARLIDLQSPKIVYVSCNPATLARDTQVICAAGYKLKFAQPLDMFPQTHHVETISVFER